jgi:predicted Zn-dependent peptidase
VSVWRAAAFFWTSGCLVFVGGAQASALEVQALEEPLRSTAVVRWEVLSGAGQDPRDQQGLAHFTARSLWVGTRSRPRADLEQALQVLGARIQVQIEQGKAVLFSEVPAGFFEPFLFILRDVLTQPEFDPTEMARLKALIRSEIRENGAQNAWLGTEAGIRAISPADLRACFRQSYFARNMRVEVVTPWDPGTVVDSIHRNFDTIPEDPR